MINDAAGWKGQVAESADVLAGQAASTEDWPQHTQLRLERAVMISAYALRKLSEAGELAVGFMDRPVQVVECPRDTAVPLEPFDRAGPDLFDRYDMRNGVNTTISLEYLCNQVIHSWIWVTCVTTSRRLDGFVIASDRDRKTCARYVNVDTLVTILRSAAESSGPNPAQYDAMIAIDVLGREADETPQGES